MRIVATRLRATPSKLVRARPVRAVLALCVGLVAGVMLVSGASYGKASNVVSVALMSNGKGAYSASLLYPSVVDKASGQTEMNDLWARSGWTPSGVVWSTVPAFRRFPARSSVDFSVGTLYPRNEFPIEALALAYRRWGGVDVTAVNDGRFPYAAQPHYENADATMDVSVSGNVLNVSVRLKNPNIQSLRFTSLTPAATVATAPPPTQRRRLSVWVILLIGLLAASVTWVLVYALAIGKAKTAGESPVPQ